MSCMCGSFDCRSCGNGPRPCDNCGTFHRPNSKRRERCYKIMREVDRAEYEFIIETERLFSQEQ